MFIRDTLIHDIHSKTDPPVVRSAKTRILSAILNELMLNPQLTDRLEQIAIKKFIEAELKKGSFVKSLTPYKIATAFLKND